MSTRSSRIWLAFSRIAWQAMRPLVVDRRGMLMGSVKWRRVGTDAEALVHRAEHIADNLRIEQLSPLAEYCVVHLASTASISSAAYRLLERIAPSPTQRVVVLVLSSDQPDRWEGAVWDRGEIVPLDGFRVVGPGMLRVERKETSFDDAPELRQIGLYSRLRGAVGESVFRELRRSTVVIVGTSRNGTLAAQMFAALGVARLRLIDGDTLGLENIDGMPAVSREKIGHPMPEAVADALLRQRDDLAISCGNRSLLHPKGAALLAESTQLLVSCVDHSDAPRVACGLYGQRMLIPHLDLATSVTRAEQGETRIIGDARLFLSGEGCCACAPNLSPAEREDVLYRLTAPVDALERGDPPAWFEQRAGSLITINAATVAAGVQSWLDLLGGHLRGSHWQRLDWIPGEGLRTRSSTVGAGEGCLFCSAT